MTTSLYIHWPFCESKCPYCDFNSHVRDKIEYERWLNSYLKEIEYYKKLLGHIEISTIFFGGGTPSLMKPEMVEKIISKVQNEFIIEKNAEITLEANPSSFEVEKFKSFKNAGINRVSIGVQSFDESNLKFLGRRHDKKQAVKAIEEAGKIFGNFSFDLIYALPKQDLESWNSELDYALSFATPHISLYQLTIEKGTAFFSDYNAKKFELPEEELATDLYNLTVEKCATKNLVRYEVSNFAKSGFESRHNLNYWKYNDYIGIGPGAHGRISNNNSKQAYFNIHNPESWIEKIETSNNSIQQSENLSQKEAIQELLVMGLRIKEGIELKKFEELGVEFENVIKKKILDDMIKEKLIILSKYNLSLTDKGLLVCNSVVKKLASDLA